MPFSVPDGTSSYSSYSSDHLLWKGAEKHTSALFHFQAQGLALSLLILVHHLWRLSPMEVGWLLSAESSSLEKGELWGLVPSYGGLGGAVPASIVHHLHCLGQLAFHIKFTLYRLSCSGMLGDHCYGLNCVPQNSYVEALTPNTSEYGYIWRQGLQKGDQVKEAIRMGLNPTGWYP